MTTKVKSFTWNDGSGDLLSCELLTGKGNGEIIISSPLNEYLDREQDVIVSGLVMDNFNSFEVDDDTITLTENTICVPNFGVKSTAASGRRIFRFLRNNFDISLERVIPNYKIIISGLYEGEDLWITLSYGDSNYHYYNPHVGNGSIDIPGATIKIPEIDRGFGISLAVLYNGLLDERPSTPVYITVLPTPCPITVSQEGAREIFSASDGGFIPSEENLFATLKS